MTDLPLFLVLPLLPPDDRARAACVCRAWRAAAAEPELLRELDFQGATSCVNDATLAALCARSGAALRTLRLYEQQCQQLTADGILAALCDGGCAGLRFFGLQQNCDLEGQEAIQLAAICPLLELSDCSVDADGDVSAAAQAAGALPGPLALEVWSYTVDPITTNAGDLRRMLQRSVTSLHLDACLSRAATA